MNWLLSVTGLIPAATDSVKQLNDQVKPNMIKGPPQTHEEEGMWPPGGSTEPQHLHLFLFFVSSFRSHHLWMKNKCLKHQRFRAAVTPSLRLTVSNKLSFYFILFQRCKTLWFILHLLHHRDRVGRLSSFLSRCSFPYPWIWRSSVWKFDWQVFVGHSL